MSPLLIGQIITLIAYLLAARFVWRRIRHLQENPEALISRAPAAVTASAGLLVHLLTLYLVLFQHEALQLGLSTAVSLVGAVIVFLYLLTYTRMPVDNLGLLLLPAVALSVLGQIVWPGSEVSIETTPPATLHIAVSLIAYGLLAIAATQGILLLIQERQLRKHHPGGFLRTLPPLQTVESLMFQLIWIGFAMLSMTLLSGMFFSEELFGQPFRFNHHIIIGLAGWVVFAVLLLGRWRLGWRGKVAALWTLGGFALLMLAYFGTKFVLEVILHRVS